MNIGKYLNKECVKLLEFCLNVYDFFVCSGKNSGWEFRLAVCGAVLGDVAIWDYAVT